MNNIGKKKQINRINQSTEKTVERFEKKGLFIKENNKIDINLNCIDLCLNTIQ